jgi:hypothetical protein
MDQMARAISLWAVLVVTVQADTGSEVPARSSMVPAAVPKAADQPDDDTILQWAGLDKEANVAKTLPVKLGGGEDAFVAEIERDYGRNDMAGAYLVRPSLKGATLIIGSVHGIDPVPAVIADSNRFVVIFTGASGQGDIAFGSSLVYFNDWESVILHEVNLLDSAACSNFADSDFSCSQNELHWKYDSNNNDLLLLETIVSAEWRTQPTNCKVPATRTETTYRIKNLQLSVEKTRKTRTTIDIPCARHVRKKGS